MKYKQACIYCNTLIENNVSYCPSCGKPDPIKGGTEYKRAYDDKTRERLIAYIFHALSK
jgi:rRNA maturation endonuclease Nob1